MVNYLEIDYINLMHLWYTKHTRLFRTKILWVDKSTLSRKFLRASVRHLNKIIKTQHL